MIDYQKSRFLVLGGTGFIGTNTVGRLLEQGAHVRVSKHKRAPKINHPRVEYIDADLTLKEDCQKLVKGMDYVFMCAANTSGAAVMKKTPLVHVTPNLIMNSQILEASYYEKIKKFVFISSSAAYPPTQDRPVCENEMFSKEDPYESYYAVGHMKRYIEILCKLYAQKLENPLPITVIRPSNVYGPYDDFEPETSHMMAALIRKVSEKQNPINVWGSGKDVRDLIYIDDFLDGMFRAFERQENYYAVNIAQGQGYSIKEVIESILSVANLSNTQLNFDPSKPSTIPVRLVNIDKAKEDLDLHPRLSLKEGIEKTLNWYSQYSNN